MEQEGKESQTLGILQVLSMGSGGRSRMGRWY